MEAMRTGGCIITVLYFLHFSVNLLKSKVCSFCHICNFSPIMTKNNNQENNLVKSKMSSFISRRMRTYTFTGPDDRFRCPDGERRTKLSMEQKMFPPCGPQLCGELFRAPEIFLWFTKKKKLHTGGAGTTTFR